MCRPLPVAVLPVATEASSVSSTPSPPHPHWRHAALLLVTLRRTCAAASTPLTRPAPLPAPLSLSLLRPSSTLAARLPSTPPSPGAVPSKSTTIGAPPCPSLPPRPRNRAGKPGADAFILVFFYRSRRAPGAIPVDSVLPRRRRPPHRAPGELRSPPDHLPLPPPFTSPPPCAIVPRSPPCAAPVRPAWGPAWASRKAGSLRQVPGLGSGLGRPKGRLSRICGRPGGKIKIKIK